MLRCGWYASCGHAGGLSCLYLFQRQLFNKSKQFQFHLIHLRSKCLQFQYSILMYICSQSKSVPSFAKQLRFLISLDINLAVKICPVRITKRIGVESFFPEKNDEKIYP